MSSEEHDFTVATPLCGNAFEGCPGWKLDKCIKLPECRCSKDAKVCIFDGDSVKVLYELEVKRQKEAEIWFTWPLTVINQSHHCKKPKITVKAYLCSSSSCSDGDPCSKCKPVGEFCQDTKEVEPRRSHQFVLTGCFPHEVSHEERKKKNKKLRLVAVGSVGKVSICLTVSSGSSTTNKILLRDRPLQVEEVIDCPKTIPVCALYNTGKDGNIDCCEVVRNCAGLYPIHPKEDRKHDTDAAPTVTSETCLKIDCAKIRLCCKLSNTECVSNWCLCKSSEPLAKDEIKYTIKVQRQSIKTACAELEAKVDLEGCTPCYDKCFTLEVFKLGTKGKCSVAREEFKLGVSSNCFRLSKKTCQLVDDDSGEFLYVLSYHKQTYELERGIATEHEGNCGAEEKKSCHEGWNINVAHLTDELEVDSSNYRVTNHGTFDSEERLRKFLCGHPITVSDDRKIWFTLRFNHCVDTVRNTAHLCADSERHKVTASSTVEDCLRGESDNKSCGSRSSRSSRRCDDEDKPCRRRRSVSPHHRRDSSQGRRERRSSSPRAHSRDDEYERRREKVHVPPPLHRARREEDRSRSHERSSKDLYSEKKQAPFLTAFRQ